MKVLCVVIWGLVLFSVSGFESDELLVGEEDEFGLEGGITYPRPDLAATSPPNTISRRRHSSSSNVDSDSKVHFFLEHAFGPLDSHFSPAGNFSARLKSTSHGSQTLIKLRFSRNAFSDSDKQKFQKLLEDDDFYRIRLPSNVLKPLGRDFVTSSVKARCLPRHYLDEHIVIHMDGTNVLAVNYGSSVPCLYPRQMKLPVKWTFNSHAVLKNTDYAPRAPLFSEATIGGPDEEDPAVKPPEKSFWAKYWMYLLPLGFVVMNAMTQAMNMPEEQGPPGSQPSGGAAQRAPNTAVRRR